MSSEAILLLVGFFALLALSGTFSGSETAVFSLHRIQLRRMERSSSRFDRLVAAVASRPGRLLAAILLGNTVVNVASSSVLVAFLRRVEGVGDPVVVSVVAGTVLVLVFGEILPKGFAVHWPERAAPILVTVLSPWLRVFSPVARLLEHVAHAFLRLLGFREHAGKPSVGRQEIRILLEDMQAREGLSESEGELAGNVFDFFETRAYEVMTPRVDLVGLSVDLSGESVREAVVATRHSRIPVYKGSLDQIVGYINAKEFLLDPEQRLETALRPVHFVPERARLHRILSDIQSGRHGIVVVVNEYGGTSGIITREDIAEEIVGEIFDEQEREELPEIESIGAGEWRVAGLLPLADLAEALEVAIEEGPAETVAGQVAHLLGRLPRAGDTVTDGLLTFRVLQVRRHRAQRVHVTVAAPEQVPEDVPE